MRRVAWNKWVRYTGGPRVASHPSSCSSSNSVAPSTMRSSLVLHEFLHLSLSLSLFQTFPSFSPVHVPPHTPRSLVPVCSVVGGGGGSWQRPRYLLRRRGLRNKKNCGVKRGKRKDKKRVPTTHHGLGPSLRLVKGWVTLWISLESGPMKRERYTCTNTSTRRIVRDAVSSLCVCVCGVQRVNITMR